MKALFIEADRNIIDEIPYGGFVRELVVSRCRRGWIDWILQRPARWNVMIVFDVPKEASHGS